MDEIYPTFNWNSTKKICIKSYFEEFGKFLVPSEYENLNVIFFSNEIQDLAAKCSPSLLDFDGEPGHTRNDQNTVDKATNIPADTKLETLKNLKRKYASQAQNNSKEPSQNQIEIPVFYKKSDQIAIAAVPNSDILVYIRVYHPFKYDRGSTYKTKISLSMVIACLGSQTLDKLRDLIFCVSDLTSVRDLSEDPWAEAKEKAITNKEIYKSGFFFIEDTFYNDTRDENMKDNSAVLRHWAETKGMSSFHSAKMEETRIDSLTVRFGYPFVYQHQGTCEHWIVFSNARFVHYDDDLDASHYPKIDRIHPWRHNLCMMCNDRQVQWLVTESDRIPHDPCYFCESCFKSYNYVNGKKIGKFKAFLYPYDPEIVKKWMGNEETAMEQG